MLTWIHFFLPFVQRSKVSLQNHLPLLLLLLPFSILLFPFFYLTLVMYAFPTCLRLEASFLVRMILLYNTLTFYTLSLPLTFLHLLLPL